MRDGVFKLLADSGIDVRLGSRNYRPTLSWPRFETKLLKPQNVVKMLHAGSRDIGFAGADWVAELGADLIELLDTGLDPVRVVAAAPASLLDGGMLPAGRHLVLATEYVRVAERWAREQPFEAVLVRSYGATEVFPPKTPTSSSTTPRRERHCAATAWSSRIPSCIPPPGSTPTAPPSTTRTGAARSRTWSSSSIRFWKRGGGSCWS